MSVLLLPLLPPPQLATGVPWDGGAHMPRGWRPFSPLRWLSEWLVRAATAPPPGSVPEGGGLDGLDAFGLAQHISLEVGGGVRAGVA